MSEITKEEVIAYSEINNILNHIEKEYYQKIPIQLIDFFKDNALGYGLYYDDKGNLKISKLAEQILCYINLKYWATEEEKQDLLIKYNENQEKINESYDISKIFEQKKLQKVEKIEETHLIINISWFQKIITKIKRILRKN